MQRLPACGSDELHELCLTFIHKTPERSPRISESLPGMVLMPMLDTGPRAWHSVS